MEKVKKWIVPLLQAISITMIIFLFMLIIVGAIVMMINLVNNTPTNLFQRASFYVVFVVGVGIALFCMAKK